MQPNYKQDEMAIKIIIRRYMKVIDPNKCHIFMIHCKKFKTPNLIFGNNPSPQKYVKIIQINI